MSWARLPAGRARGQEYQDEALGVAPASSGYPLLAFVG